MPILNHFLLAFIATIGFSILFNVPKKSLFYAGITGGLGWSVYIYSKDITLSSTFSNFFAACVVGIIGEIFARVDKKPVTFFIIPGIVPLVPGFGMYSTMITLINNDYAKAAQIGIETLSTSGAIVIGIVLISSIAKILKSQKAQKL